MTGSVHKKERRDFLLGLTRHHSFGMLEETNPNVALLMCYSKIISLMKKLQSTATLASKFGFFIRIVCTILRTIWSYGIF
ncbi:hypothetical protein PVAP13_3KG220400 [Panicum virgatum]|uniref:Uncharacterized protein n=1 Tax=Panicum virgatum TaxID=38727 RepID=A0A8T0UUG5_PANVG|nr:hypothetical protein PVAP13_3KG220400 [Panicum virgatum]